jgi:hypothetical protein
MFLCSRGERFFVPSADYRGRGAQARSSLTEGHRRMRREAGLKATSAWDSAAAIVLRLGPASEWLTWPIPMVVSRFAGVLRLVAEAQPGLINSG